MRYTRTAALALLGSLVLLAGCGDQLPTDIPDSYGYDGFVSLGWEAYGEQDYEQALDYFKDGIDVDVSRPEAYLGAGWSSLFVADYWRVADSYFYMALQKDAGAYPMQQWTESQLQDTMWTVFQCVDEDLPPSVLDPILEMTADSGQSWVGEQIYDIVGPNPIHYRFQPTHAGVIAMFMAANGTTGETIHIDSIVDGWVYGAAPYARIEAAGTEVRSWISLGNQVSYSYETFNATGSETQISKDALVGIAMLQDIRGENGDPLLGAAAGLGLDVIEPDYSFGSGMEWAGLESLSNVHILGTSAGLAFAEEGFRFALFTCLGAGYGGSLDPESPDFVTGLMAVIENMLNS